MFRRFPSVVTTNREHNIFSGDLPPPPHKSITDRQTIATKSETLFVCKYFIIIVITLNSLVFALHYDRCNQSLRYIMFTVNPKILVIPLWTTFHIDHLTHQPTRCKRTTIRYHHHRYRGLPKGLPSSPKNPAYHQATLASKIRVVQVILVERLPTPPPPRDPGREL